MSGSKAKRRGARLRGMCLLLSAALLLGVVAGCSPAMLKEDPIELARRLLDSITITALDEDEAGVKVSSQFALSCDRQLEEEHLVSLLKVSPPAPYTLQKQSAGNFVLSFDTDLQKNTVYQVSAQSEAYNLTNSYVFQTERVFGIAATYPYTGYDWAELNTGIEVTFSASDVDLEPYFSIEPPVSGRFETYNYTCVFVPDKPLELDTRYAVRISGGVQSPAGETMGEDYTFTFKTTNYDPDAGYASRPSANLAQDISETFLPDDTVVVEFYAYDVQEGYTLDLYRFSGQDAYLSALEAWDDALVDNGGYESDYRIPTAGLQLLYSHEVAEEPEQDGYYTKNAVLPEHPGEGYFLAEVTLRGIDGTPLVLQKMIQVSDVSVYSQSLNGRTLFWLHSTATGQPLSGASVRLYSTGGESHTVTANSDGIAETEALEEPFRFFGVEVSGATRFVDRNPLTGYSDPPAGQRYYSMLYKDREIYQPSDTIHVWGVVRQRRDEFESPTYVQARLYQGYGWYYETADPLTSPALYYGEAQLEADGSFTLQIDHSSLCSGNYYIALTTPDGVIINSSTLVISDYVKPDYIVKTELNQLFYEPGDRVSIDTTVSFYDGTPAHDMALFAAERWWYDTRPDDGVTARTDAEGHAVLTLDALGDQSNDRWQPYSVGYRLQSTDSQAAPANAYLSAVVVPRDVMMETRYSVEGDRGVMEITANHIDTGAITNAAQLYENNYQNIRGAPADIPVDIRIARTRYVRGDVVGSYYDFINRETVYRYNYVEERSTVDIQTVRTSGGSVVVTDLPVADSEYSYTMIISAQDSRGRTISSTHYLYGNYGYANPNYDLYFDIGRDYDDTRYALGEEIALSVKSWGRPMDMSGGRLLYTFYQDRVVHSGIVGATSVRVPFSEDMIPNVGVSGAYFDGRHVYKIGQDWGMAPQFEYSARALDVAVSADKEAYRPGERATVTLRVTDGAGLPVSGSSVVLGVVDEAIFTLRAQNMQPLAQLYSSVYSTGSIQQYVSYIQHLPWLDGGKGGGGGDEDDTDTREKFEDTALFRADVTGPDGTAEFTFTVPDNLTSWRLTAIAVDDELRAGVQVENVVGTLPYFVQPMVNSRFLEGEDVVFTAKVFGENTGASTIEVNINGGEHTQTSIAQYGDFAEFNFGKLPGGVYNVQMDARGEGYTDSVKLRFAVVDSLMELPLSEAVTLSGAQGLSSLRYPLTLAVYDAEYAGVAECLARLGAYNPVRFDQLLGLKVAQDVVARTAVDDVRPGFADVDVDLSILRYDDAALTATYAKGAIAAPDYVNRGELISFFYDRLRAETSSEEMVAAAYMGLAALHEPVLLDVRAKLKKSDDETQRLYYIAALAALGDLSGAGELYDAEVAPRLNTRGEMTWHDATGASAADEIYLHTSTAYFTALLLGRDEALGMLRYLADTRSDRYTCLLESAAYLVHFRPSGTTARLRYTVNGEENTVDLSGGGVKYLQLSEQALQSARFETVSGQVGARAFFTAGPEAFTSAGERYATIRKSVSDRGSLQMGDLVEFTVTLHFADDAPEGWYCLTDFLPSGMRYMSSGLGVDNNYYYDVSQVSREKDQKLTVWIYMSNHPEYTSNRDYTITYYGRVMYTGAYIAESAYLLHEDDLVSLRTERIYGG